MVFFESLKEAEEEIRPPGSPFGKLPRLSQPQQCAIREGGQRKGSHHPHLGKGCGLHPGFRFLLLRGGGGLRQDQAHRPGPDGPHAGRGFSIKVSENFDLTMRGPVEEICVGKVSGELLQFLESHSK